VSTPAQRLSGTRNSTTRTLDGQVAVITGAAGGIGTAITQAFVAEGARVVLVGRSIDTLEALVAQMSGEDCSAAAMALRCDVSEPDQAAATVAQVEATHGRVDVLVNNAGAFITAPIEEMSFDDFDRVVRSSLYGAWLMSRAAVPRMKANRHGSIVNISSIAATAGTLHGSGYSAAKAAMIGFTKSLARELGPFNVRVNSVLPGIISAGMWDGLTPELRARKVAEVPMGRPGTAEEVADAVLYLAGERSSYVTGTAVDVTGGRAMY
jgi:3-oxoacyl-[acyl-carrier protein] reductase